MADCGSSIGWCAGKAHAHLQPVHDLVSQLVYSAQGTEVSTTIVEGKILFERGRFTTLNEKRIYAKAANWQKKIAAVIRAPKQ